MSVDPLQQTQVERFGLDPESVEPNIEHGLSRVRLARRERPCSVPVQRGQATRAEDAQSLRKLDEDRDA